MQPSGKLPTYEETTQVSNSLISTFISQLENAQSCKSLLLVLVSDNGLSPDDKCKAMEEADELPALAQEKETIWLEDRLQLQSSHKLAQSTAFPVDRQHEDSQDKECTSTGTSLLNYAKIVRGEEVVVGGCADVAKDNERSMSLTQKGCITEATALQRAPAVWTPTGSMVMILEMRSQTYKIFTVILPSLDGQIPIPCVYSRVTFFIGNEYSLEWDWGISKTNVMPPKPARSNGDRTTEFPSTKMQSQQKPPTYDESMQNATKKYTKRVEHAETPEDLLEPLLSDELSIDEKRELIELAPDVVFVASEEDKTPRTLTLETWLENANYDELAQRVAYRFHLLNASSNRDWCRELIKLDITLRWTVQCREWLEQKAKALQAYPKLPRDEQEQGRENTRIGISRVCFVKTVQNEGAVVDADVDVARGHE
ncbi:hypothetical protein PITC_089360 [Penicillium italicum]|uniref:Uncharacterized protein n=1 Tax=Penicillium italicum TaxID=40296 RepID=A0A0A2LC69_PENIT|nr:hypothetical protein PITC_089360 [Penicillium italicum]